MAQGVESRIAVLLKQKQHCDDPYEKALQSAGCAAHFVPVLQFEFTNLAELSASLLDPNQFSGIVLTSQTAIEAIQKAIESSEDFSSLVLREKWKDHPAFVIGKRTEQLAQELGLQCLGSESGNADALSNFIIEYFKTHQSNSTPLLFPCGNLRKDTLPNRLEEAGIGLHCLVCYKTIPHPTIELALLDLIKQKILSESTYVVFFSPSGVKNTKEFFQTYNLIDQIKVVAIGPSTAEALQKNGVIRPLVAAKPTPEALMNVIICS